MKIISVFASGSGTNLQSLIDRMERGEIDARIAFVLSNNSGAKALERARNHGIPSIHFSTKTHPDPVQYEQALLELHARYKVDIVVLAGYMKLLPSLFIRTYENRILNIHPSLLPKFGGKGMYGLNVHEAVLKAGEVETGATVFYVTESYDEGPVILQERVVVLKDDTPETLQKRVLETEYRIYAEALRRVISRT